MDLSRVPTPCLESWQMEIAAELQGRQLDEDGFQNIDDYYKGRGINE